MRKRCLLPPPAISIIGGSIVTCSGNLSTGVNLANGAGPFQVLNVGDLTADIAPASGIAGIEFSSNGSVELNVDPGPFGIFATDANAIFASSNTGAVTIASTADISTTGNGATAIQGAVQNSLLTITSSGNIATSGNNAFGIAAGTVYGDIIVNSTGDIATSGTFSAGINVGSIGAIGHHARRHHDQLVGRHRTTGIDAIGINASTVYGPVTINSTGNIAVSGTAAIGINVQTQGDVQITSIGNIAAGPDSSVGILALSQSATVTDHLLRRHRDRRQTGIGIYASAERRPPSVHTATSPRSATTRPVSRRRATPAPESFRPETSELTVPLARGHHRLWVRRRCGWLQATSRRRAQAPTASMS